MNHAFRNGKAYICQNPSCKKKFYKYGYASSNTVRYVYGASEEELNATLDYIESQGEWRRQGEASHYSWSGQWAQTMKATRPDTYGPFFHSQGCMYDWIGDNIADIHNIILAQNNNSVNIPE
tara:strand:- start:7 stop:372 length:366 start_codon:yes stop_codon:yes gene_type:complete